MTTSPPEPPEGGWPPPGYPYYPPYPPPRPPSSAGLIVGLAFVGAFTYFVTNFVVAFVVLMLAADSSTSATVIATGTIGLALSRSAAAACCWRCANHGRRDWVSG